MKNIPVYQQYDEDYKLLLLELLLFLSLSDLHNEKYLSCLDFDGVVRLEIIQPEECTPVSFNPLKSLTKSATETNRRIFSLSLADLLIDDEQILLNSFLIKLKLLRLRSIFDLLLWVYRRSPETSSSQNLIFLESDLNYIKQYFKVSSVDPLNYKNIAKNLISQNTENSLIDWNIFNPRSFLNSDIWLKARTLASEIISLLNMSNIPPESGICFIAIQFED